MNIDRIHPLWNAPLTRRQMLGRTSAGFGLMSLAGLLGQQQAVAANPGVVGRANLPAKTKRVIFLFLNGGPSQIDMFDHKPALKKYEGQKPTEKLYRMENMQGFLPSIFSFAPHGQSGIKLSETVPHLAKVIDDCCLVQSMKTDVPNHEPALIQMHTGNVQPIRPSVGSWMLYGLGSENQNLPGYVVLRPSSKIVVGPMLWSNSFLPGEFQATSVITSDLKVDKMLANIRNSKWGPNVQRRQLDLLEKLNRQHLKGRNDADELETQIKAMETAFHMQSEAIDAFDVSREPQYIRDMYGTTPFAQSCLLARRLAESGVRFTTVYYTTDGSNQPWDTHANHNKKHVNLCADSDQAAAALIRDLKSRGMLDDTLVIFGGEFGRTPYGEKRGKRPMGRDHHDLAFSMLMAGGGLKRGHVYGATDELGMHIVENPMHIHDFHATILHLMGLDHKELTYRYGGRDFRLTDVHGDVAHDIIA